MANKKLSQLPETLALLADDIFAVVINTDTVPETKKIKFQDFESSLDHSAIGGLSGDDHTQYFNASRHSLLVHTNLGLVPSTRKINSGAGFSGGGDLSADRTLDIGAGFGILVGTYDISINTETNYVWSGNHEFQGGFITKHITPKLTDTYDLGSNSLLWRKGWLSELDTILFAKNTITLLGGWLMITKGEGALNADISAAATQIDFGQSMTVADYVVLRSSLQVEYIQVGVLSSGTTYNVVRNVDGSGAKDWPMGSPFAVLGNTGSGRIELNAYDSPRISILEQGATYNAQTERIRIGDLAAWQSAGFTGYGIAIGNYSGGESLVYSPTGGLEVRGTIKADDGYLQNLTVQGLLNLNTSGELRAGDTTNGLRFGYLSNGYYLRGIGGGTTQIEIRASDGKMYAAAGKIVIDSQGLRLTSDVYETSGGWAVGNNVNWVDSQGGVRAYISNSIFTDGVSGQTVARLGINASGQAQPLNGMIVLTAGNQSAQPYQYTEFTMKDGKFTFGGSYWVHPWIQITGDIWLESSGLDVGDVMGDYRAVTFVVGDGLNVLTNGTTIASSIPCDMDLVRYEIYSHGASPTNLATKLSYYNGSTWVDHAVRTGLTGYFHRGTFSGVSLQKTNASRNSALAFFVTANGGAKCVELTLYYRKTGKGN